MTNDDGGAAQDENARVGLRVNGGNRPRSRPSFSYSEPEGRYGERQEKQTHRLSPPRTSTRDEDDSLTCRTPEFSGQNDE